MATFGIVTMYDDYERYAPGIKSVERYAQRHGYPLVASRERITPEPKNIMWDKPELLLRYHGIWDWTLWLDADTLVINPAVPLHEFTDSAPSHNLIGAKDQNGFNTGVMLIRRDPATWEWICRSNPRWHPIGTGIRAHPWHDQAALLEIMADMGDAIKPFWIRHDLFNAFPHEVHNQTFVCHCAGMQAHKDKARIIREVASRFNLEI